MRIYKSRAWLENLLLEDCPGPDLTVDLLGIGNTPGRLFCHPKTDCVLSGAEEAAAILELCGVNVELLANNGSLGRAGQVFLSASGPASALHRGWKIAQNIMEYMSGIASRAASMVELAQAVNPDIQVAVTRKNFPGAKTMCLEAALSGGAIIHRTGLSDSILVFEQHRNFLAGADQAKRLRSFAAQLNVLRKKMQEKKISAEVESAADALLLAEAGLEIIQCEHFQPAQLQDTVSQVRAINPQIQILAAGGINADNAAAYAATGVDILVTSWVYFGKPVDIKVRLEAL